MEEFWIIENSNNGSSDNIVDIIGKILILS